MVLLRGIPFENGIAEDGQHEELFTKFREACEELDKIVRLLSELLTEQSILTVRELEQLQDKIKRLAVEIKEASPSGE